MKTKLLTPLLALTILIGVSRSEAQSTAFTYQGRLADNGSPASGNYDLRFTIYDSTNKPGVVIAGPLTNASAAVSNGLFTTVLDFGAAPFDGSARFLEIAARPTGSGTFTVLTPRQPLTATPYATRSLNSGLASSVVAGAINTTALADGAVTALKLAPGAVSQLGAADGSPINAVQVDGNGLVGIGTLNPQDSRLDVEGDIHVNDFDIYLRAGFDRDYGLGYRASLAGNGGEGPFLYGFDGGALGVGNPDTAVLTWSWDGHVTVSNSLTTAFLMVDRYGVNSGDITPGMVFGGDSGEGIASKRTAAGGNQNSLNFYTAFLNRMSINNNGRVGIGTTNPASALHVIGTVTATAFNPPSDRNLKENFVPVSAREVLDKVTAMPISRWNFKGDSATPHVGPMAQDFHAAFGLGTDDKHIATVDADGVALAAIQGLNQKLDEKEARIAELELRLARLERLMNRENGGAK